ncbi:MAG: HEAT repeat domain-containing protein [Planctomycetes bacterium]|nr:HEAT repeat domain-containing protein [Planctomycetota bacterium]
MRLRFLINPLLKTCLLDACGCGWLAICLVVALPGASLQADILHLNNGRFVEGAVEEVAEGYRLTTATSSLIYKTEQVKRWEKKVLPEEEYLLRKANTPADDVDGNYILALWCKQRRFFKEADYHFAQVFRLAPDHREAREAAGFVYKNGEWLTRSESLRRQGYLPYKGKWLPKEEALALQDKEHTEQERQEVVESGWKILKAARKVKNGQTRILMAEKLAGFGVHINMVLIQAMNDPSPRTREVAIRALGMRPENNCAEALCRRLRNEFVPELQELLAASLAGHQNRAVICKRLVTSLLETSSRKKRRRLVYAFQVIQDPRLIPMLIVNSEYTPVQIVQGDTPPPPRKMIEVPDETAPEGWRLEPVEPQEDDSGDPDEPASSVRYPAAEALAVLTGMDFGNDRAAWEKWWQNNSKDFTFSEPKLP